MPVSEYSGLKEWDIKSIEFAVCSSLFHFWSFFPPESFSSIIGLDLSLYKGIRLGIRESE